MNCFSPLNDPEGRFFSILNFFEKVRKRAVHSPERIDLLKERDLKEIFRCVVNQIDFIVSFFETN